MVLINENAFFKLISMNLSQLYSFVHLSNNQIKEVEEKSKPNQIGAFFF